MGRLPFVAVASAGVANVGMMRSSDWRIGVSDKVTNEELCEGKKSIVSGKTAIAQVAFTRVITACPFLTFPPVAMMCSTKTKFSKTPPWLTTPFYIFVLTLVLQGAIPPTLAWYPQTAELPVT